MAENPPAQERSDHLTRQTGPAVGQDDSRHGPRTSFEPGRLARARRERYLPPGLSSTLDAASVRTLEVRREDRPESSGLAS